MHVWGINPGPDLLNRGIQHCQDWLSALTGDRCVYVRVDVRAAGPPSDGTNFLFTLDAKCLEKCCIIADVYIYVYICVYHKKRGGSKGECLRLPWRACTHVFLPLMSAYVCHGWVSVQTKAPQRTKAHVINLSGRQDLKGYSRQGKPWSTDRANPAGTSRLESDWRTLKLPLPAALIVRAPMSLLNHWLLLEVSRQMHHLSASTSPGRELAQRESHTRK